MQKSETELYLSPSFPVSQFASFPVSQSLSMTDWMPRIQRGVWSSTLANRAFYRVLLNALDDNGYVDGQIKEMTEDECVMNACDLVQLVVCIFFCAA